VARVDPRESMGYGTGLIGVVLELWPVSKVCLG
jgi:hypothetical protein